MQRNELKVFLDIAKSYGKGCHLTASRFCTFVSASRWWLTNFIIYGLKWYIAALKWRIIKYFLFVKYFWSNKAIIHYGTTGKMASFICCHKRSVYCWLFAGPFRGAAYALAHKPLSLTIHHHWLSLEQHDHYRIVTSSKIPSTTIRRRRSEVSCQVSTG